MKKEKQGKNRHAKLKQQAHLVVGTMNTFQENKLIEGKNSKHKSINGCIGRVKNESLFFPLRKLDHAYENLSAKV